MTRSEMLLCVLMLIGCSAFAGEPGLDAQPPDDSLAARAHGWFERLDIDGDGALSPVEVLPYAALRGELPHYDIDGDGRLQRTEFAAFLAGPAALDPDAAVASGAATARNDG